jgi:hypothetical protein
MSQQRRYLELPPAHTENGCCDTSTREMDSLEEHK